MFHQTIEVARLRRFSPFATSVAAVTIVWTFAGLVGAAPPEGKELPVDRTFNVPVPAPEVGRRPPQDVLIPGTLQGEVPITEPFQQRIVDRNAQVLIGGYDAGPNDDSAEKGLKRRLYELQVAIVEASQAGDQKRVQEVGKQLEQWSREYQEAVKTTPQASPPLAQMAAERQQLQGQLSAINARIAELTARQQIPQKAPLPENAVLKVFALRYVKPDEVGNVLFRITGNDSLRMAFDDRTNSLLLAGAEKQLNIAEALIERLDQPSQAAEKRPAETLQLRVVWLLDGVEGKAPAVKISAGDREFDSFVSPQVVEALHQIGFEEPRVVCQQLTTLTIRPEESRGGQFRFQVPVLVEGDLWQFEGQGTVSATANQKYAIDFATTVQQRDDQRQRNSSELSGSIVTPLAHYTVMGTTTFVATELKAPEGGGPGKVVAGRNQHQSAFVVFLDRARELGGESGKSEKEPAPKR